MGRIYRVTFESVSVAALQDLVCIYGGAGKVCRIKRCWWGNTNTTLTASEMLATRCQILPATVTAGSGGGAATPRPADPGDAAATATARINDTTPASTGGTANTTYEDGSHVYNGFVWAPRDEEDFPIVGPAAAFVMGLIINPATTLTLSGGVEFEELG